MVVSTLDWDFHIPEKLTPKQASVIMLVIALLAPHGVFVTSSSYSNEGLKTNFAIMAMTWVFLTDVPAGGTSYGYTEPGFHLLNSDALPYLLSMGVFGFVFAVAVVLRCVGRISRRNADGKWQGSKVQSGSIHFGACAYRKRGQGVGCLFWGP